MASDWASRLSAARPRMAATRTRASVSIAASCRAWRNASSPLSVAGRAGAAPGRRRRRPLFSLTPLIKVTISARAETDFSFFQAVARAFLI